MSTQTRLPTGSVGSAYGPRTTSPRPMAALSLCEWYTTTVSPACMARMFICAVVLVTPSQWVFRSRSRSSKL